ncbi:MAG: hypothetical protein AAB915_01380 [Patescibacteria group bacterium]
MLECCGYALWFMTFRHADLAAGRWYTLSLAEQMGNIGSEVGRARLWRGKDPQMFEGAVGRALELFDLTAADPRRRLRLKEILRAREFFLDAVEGGSEYGSTFEYLDRYFLSFAFASRIAR